MKYSPDHIKRKKADLQVVYAASLQTGKKWKDINQNNKCLQGVELQAILPLHQTFQIFHRDYLTFNIIESK